MNTSTTTTTNDWWKLEIIGGVFLEKTIGEI